MSPAWVSACGAGTCIEIARGEPVKPQWTKACGTSSCVEVRGRASDTVLIRSSKDAPGGPILEFTPEEWWQFLDGAVAGVFNDVVPRP